jgi:hypothetical protein
MALVQLLEGSHVAFTGGLRQCMIRCLLDSNFGVGGVTHA